MLPLVLATGLSAACGGAAQTEEAASSAEAASPAESASPPASEVEAEPAPEPQTSEDEQLASMLGSCEVEKSESSASFDCPTFYFRLARLDLKQDPDESTLPAIRQLLVEAIAAEAGDGMELQSRETSFSLPDGRELPATELLMGRDGQVLSNSYIVVLLGEGRSVVTGVCAPENQEADGVCRQVLSALAE